MKTDTPNTIYLKDYTPPLFAVESLQLRFELGEDQTVVTSLMKLHRQGESSAPLCLNGQDLLLAHVKVDGVQLAGNEYQVDDETLTLHVPENCELEIQTIIKPQENTSLEGLYKSSGNFCTQCEAEGFRKITYYLDRPDVMTLFTTT